MRKTTSTESIDDLLGSDLETWVLHDVFEEHFEELEFCVASFLQGHAHPLHTFRVLENGIEPRLMAHLDALDLAGPKVVQTLTAPILEDLDPNEAARVSAAVLALARVGRADDTVPFFEHEAPAVRAAAAVGGSLAGTPSLDALARARTAQPSASPESSGWLELIGLRGLRPPNLFPALVSKSDALVVAALSALRGHDTPAFISRLEELAQSPNETIRERALSLALAWGAPRAWGICEHQALDGEQVFPFSMLAYAVLGGSREHQRLLESRRRPTHRLQVLRALGMSGNRDMVPPLLEHLRSNDGIEAKVAVLSISAITGLNLRDEAFEAAGTEAAAESDSLPPLEDDDLDADLVPPPEDDLPRPDAAAIERWWANQGPSLSAETRYVLGRPFTATSLLAALESGPLGLRRRWALALAIRSRGGVWLNTSALTPHQREALADARAAVTTLAPARSASF